MSSNQEAAVLMCEFVNGDRYRKFKNSVQIKPKEMFTNYFGKLN